MGQKMPIVQINVIDKTCKPRWYTVVTKFNYEKKFASNLMNGLKNSGMSDSILDIVVPLKEYEVVTTTKTGKARKTIKVEKIYPSYVFVKAIMNERVWNYINNITGCATILATGADLAIMNDKEVQKIKEICGYEEKVTSKQANEQKMRSFQGKKNDLVKVIDGVFLGYKGTIINKDIAKAKITIELLENGMNIEINVDDIELI